MEESSKYITDTKQLTIALLDDIFGDATELQHHPLVNSLTGTQKRQLIYNSLAKCTQKDIDRILKGIINNGFARGLTILLQH